MFRPHLSDRFLHGNPNQRSKQSTHKWWAHLAGAAVKHMMQVIIIDGMKTQAINAHSPGESFPKTTAYVANKLQQYLKIHTHTHKRTTLNPFGKFSVKIKKKKRLKVFLPWSKYHFLASHYYNLDVEWNFPHQQWCFRHLPTAMLSRPVEWMFPTHLNLFDSNAQQWVHDFRQ